MDRATEYRVQQIAENADDGCELRVPYPPEPWYCYSDECGRTMNPHDRLNCQYCGRAREDNE